MAFYRCSGGKRGMREIVEDGKGIPCPALFLSPQAAKAVGESEAGFAFYLARRAFAEKANISSKLSNEALLFLARQTNFSSAVRKLGAKDAKAFVLVLEEKLAPSKVKKLLGLKSVKLIAKKRAKAARGGELYAKDMLCAEEMALSRIRN